MPKIVITTPKLDKEVKEKLVKDLYDVTYSYINNREIYTYVYEPDFYVNAEEKSDGYMSIDVGGPKLEEEKLKGLYKDLYDVAIKHVGERRILFTYILTDPELIGINGLTLDDYRKAKNK